ncbi:unnamed protein product [Phytophthora lilii]|uniref:Unnamed protein product n=1 Tax=Phytophthora lilii TaxID=2077276 RepID=A0A9W6X3M3_9STRA|nr:unnamed protein product [Phytophthora lilii]
MSTTPGFLEQMDRLILACHSGASGPSLRSVMTKDLRIRRQKDEVQVKTEVTSNQQPAISPANSATRSRVESSDDEVPPTVGTASRQWGTRKRLSTRNHAPKQRASKRLKRSLAEEWGRDQDESEEEKRKPTQEVKKRSARSGLRRMKDSKRPKRRSKRVRRIGIAFGNNQGIDHGSDGDVDEEKPKRNQSARIAKRNNAERGKRVRWNLRSLPSSGYDSSERKPARDFRFFDRLVTTRKKTPTGKHTSALEKSTTTSLDTSVASEDDLAPETAGLDPSVSVEHDEVSKTVALTSDAPEQHVVQDSEMVVCDAGAQNADSSTTNSSEVGSVDMVTSRDDHSDFDYEEQAKAGVVETFDQNKNAEVAQASGKVESNTAYTVSPDNDFHSVFVHESIDRRSSENADTQKDSGGQPCESYNTEQKSRDQPDSIDSPLATVVIPQDKEVNDLVEADEYAQEDAYSEIDDEPAVPGLCDAGMRPPNQVNLFKVCLRKSIQFVDAVLCKPPPGKRCSRNCRKIRSRQCSEGVPCRDPHCRNWHETEAHTEHCKNPLCEFRNRILLREIMHQITNQDTHIQSLFSKWEDKSIALIRATTDNSSNQCTEEQIQELKDTIGQLERRIDDAKEDTESLKDTRRMLLANLSAIGVIPQDDVTDGFPDFETHYV